MQKDMIQDLSTTTLGQSATEFIQQLSIDNKIVKDKNCWISINHAQKLESYSIYFSNLTDVMIDIHFNVYTMGFDISKYKVGAYENLPSFTLPIAMLQSYWVNNHDIVCMGVFNEETLMKIVEFIEN